MPKSTKVIGIHVPVGKEDYYKKIFKARVLEDEGNELYLFIRDNPSLTIAEVYKHFGSGDRAKKEGIINMCNKTGLTLADYRPKQKKKSTPR